MKSNDRKRFIELGKNKKFQLFLTLEEPMNDLDEFNLERCKEESSRFNRRFVKPIKVA
jgi:hypothetical protein